MAERPRSLHFFVAADFVDGECIAFVVAAATYNEMVDVVDIDIVMVEMEYEEIVCSIQYRKILLVELINERIHKHYKLNRVTKIIIENYL